MANHLEQPNFMSTDDKIKKNKAEVKEVSKCKYKINNNVIFSSYF